MMTLYNINYASRVVNYAPRVMPQYVTSLVIIIYDSHMLIVQAIGVNDIKHSFSLAPNKLERLSLAKHISLVLYLRVRPEPTKLDPCAPP